MQTFQWIQTVSFAVAAVGVMLSLITFRKNQRVRKAEWLTKLYEKFYEQEHYKDVRKWIDFGILDEQLKEDADHKKEEKLADYLNFFEFIATLEKMKQLRVDEIQNLFAYYLRLLKQSPTCSRYIAENKFKNLRTLLKKIR